MTWGEWRSFSWFVFCMLTGATIGISGFGLLVFAITWGVGALAQVMGR